MKYYLNYCKKSLFAKSYIILGNKKKTLISIYLLFIFFSSNKSMYMCMDKYYDYAFSLDIISSYLFYFYLLLSFFFFVKFLVHYSIEYSYIYICICMQSTLRINILQEYTNKPFGYMYQSIF